MTVSRWKVPVMSLVRAERRRFLKRRLTIWMMVIGVLILGAVTAGLASPTRSPPRPRSPRPRRRPSASTRSRSRVRAVQGPMRGCSRGRRRRQVRQGPQRDWFKAEHYMPPQFDFKQMFGELLIVWAAIIAMVGVRARGHLRRGRVELRRDDEPADLAAQADERAGHQARRSLLGWMTVRRRGHLRPLDGGPLRRRPGSPEHQGHDPGDLAVVRPDRAARAWR